jgi:hypothetical protein
MPRHTLQELGFPIALLIAACSTAQPHSGAAEPPAAIDEPASSGAPIDVRGSDPRDAVQPPARQLDAPPAPPAHSCTSTQRVPALDEQTTLGASPSEMLHWIGGEHHETLAWRDASGSFVAGAAASELTVVIDPPTAVQLLVSNSDDPSAGFCEQVIENFGDISTTFDELTFDVRVHVSTPDGKLKLALDTRLRSTASDYAAGWLELPLEGFPEKLPADARALFLRLGLSPFGDGGQLIVSRSANDVSEYFTPADSVFARFPSDIDCGGVFVPFAPGAQTRGVSLAAALARLNALSPLTLDDSSATLSWSFTGTARPACARIDSPARIGSWFSFPAHVALHSSDGQIEGGFDVRLDLSAANGELGFPGAAASASIEDLSIAGATAREFGIQAPLDFSGFEAGLLSFSTGRQGSDQITGSLTATGLNPAYPSCQQNGGERTCGSTGGPMQLYSVSWSRPLP